MAWVAFFALILWLPAVLYLFERFPAQKAVVFSFITAWLFLPPTLIPLSGIPDWSKTTATVFSVSLCACLKHSQRLFAIQWRWYDLPVFVYCLCPFLSSITNGLGAYDGFSAVLDELFRWGLPYVIGRAYLANASGNRQLCLGIAVGGLLYIPLCLIEIRMSPMLKSWVFGFGGGRDVDFSLRYNGYRPMVFLATGLELGWWMCCATLATYMLWVSGAVKRLANFPMGPLTVGLAFTTVMCKSTGALLQIAIGFCLIYFSRFTKNSLLVWALVLVPPAYCVARPTGIWTGEQVVDWAAATFGPERAQSLGFRFENEEILMRSALQHPVFGWARFGGFNPPDASGKTAITDGLWIIVFGWMGSVGLVALNLMLLVPTALFLRRFPPRTWLEPDVAPVTTLALILPLFMLDNLSNAMLNPIYALAMGSVAGYRPRKDATLRPADRWARHVAGGAALGEPSTTTPRALRPDFAADQAADQAEAGAVAAADRGRLDEAHDRFLQAIQCRQGAIDAQPTADRLDRLATTHTLFARTLTRSGQDRAAVAERERALALWRAIQEGDPRAEFARDRHAANLNDLAWLLINAEAADPVESDRAILLAEEAVVLAGDQSSYWNTLGVGRYRRGDYHKAIHALSRSVSLSPAGGNAFDFYYLALANQALGYPAPAVEWLDRAEVWARRHPELGPLLSRVQTEVADRFTPATRS